MKHFSHTVKIDKMLYIVSAENIIQKLQWDAVQYREAITSEDEPLLKKDTIYTWNFSLSKKYF